MISTKDQLNRAKLYTSALSFLGVDASPYDEAPDDVGCADSLSRIIEKTFPNVIMGSVSTAMLYKQLNASQAFVKVTEARPGDIIISPTGSASKPGSITFGHCGIFGENEEIMSNSSATGLWTNNFTLKSWVDRYRGLGNFKIYFFRKL